MTVVEPAVPLPPGVGSLPATSWRRVPTHRAWLDAEFQRLVGFSSDPRHPLGGFAWLDATGGARHDAPVHTWITARMTHVHALAALRGIPGSAALVDHGLAALTGPLHDAEHAGWFVSVAADWSDEEPYRGANSNMHTVEALLAAGDVTGDPTWHGRALRIAAALIDDVARAHDWRLIEHFDAGWVPALEHDREEPHHPFRPHGTTIGHWFEWARLLLHLEASLGEPPAWLPVAAVDLFTTGVRVGWAADGRAGFPYILDWKDQPVVRARMHWVVTEAIAAAALHERTQDPAYEAWYRTLRDHAAAVFLDRGDGSWHHERSPELAPAGGTWGGKPDLYHAVQATLLPQLALAPCLASQLARQAGGGRRPAGERGGRSGRRGRRALARRGSPGGKNA